MKKAYLDLIKRALVDGHSVSVWDCEGLEWLLKKSSSYKAIKDAVEMIEWSNMRIRDGQDNKVLGTAAVMLDYGQGPDESIVDWSFPADSPVDDKGDSLDYINVWFQEYSA